MFEKEKILLKHNDLITAHYDMSAPEQDIFCLILSQIKKEHSSDQLYQVSIKDIEELTQKKIDYTEIRKAAKKLLSRVCAIVRDNGNLLYVSMISDAEHVVESGYIEIGISPKLRPHLINLKASFTKYQLRIFGALRSKYSKRIYKMLSQFKHTGVMRVSVEELKNRLKLLDFETGEEKFKDWTSFVRKVLEVSKKEINEFSDLKYTYEAKKTGKKFTDVEFRVARVPFEQLKAQYGEDAVTAELHKRLIQEFKLAPWQANEIVIHIPEKEIEETFHDIQARRISFGISNMGGYVAKLFDSKYQLGFFGEKTTLEEASKVSSSSTSILPNNTEQDEQWVTFLPGEMASRKPPLVAASRRNDSYSISEEPISLGQRLKKNLGIAS